LTPDALSGATVASGSVVDVLEAHDVVLPEIVPALDLDELDRDIAEVLEAVNRTQWNMDVLVRSENAHVSIHCDLSQSADDDPMLGPVPVLLKRKAPVRVDDDALDLKSGSVIDDLVPPPGAVNMRMAMRLGAPI